MEWSSPWKTLTTVVETAQKHLDNLEKTADESFGISTTAESPQGGQGGGDGNDQLFAANESPINTPSSMLTGTTVPLRGRSSDRKSKKGTPPLPSRTKKLAQEDDKWWLSDDAKSVTVRRSLSSTPSPKPQSGETATPTAATPVMGETATPKAATPPLAPTSAQGSKQQMDKLRTNLQKAIGAAKDARAQRDRLAEELQLKTSQEKESQDTLRKMEKQLQDADQLRKTLSSERDAFRNDLEASKKTINSLQKTVQALKAKSVPTDVQPRLISDSGTEESIPTELPEKQLAGTLSTPETSPSALTAEQRSSEGVGEHPDTPSVDTSTGLVVDPDRVAELEAALKDARKRCAALEQAEQKLNATNAQINDVLTRRELQLEQQAVQMGTLNKTVEDLKDGEVNAAALQQELEAMTEQWKSANKLAKEVIDLRAELEEEQVKRKALMEEGIALSKKQGDYEKTIKELIAKAKTADQRGQESVEEMSAMEQQFKSMQKKLQENNMKMALNENETSAAQNEFKVMQGKLNQATKTIEVVRQERDELKASLQVALDNLSHESKLLKASREELAQLEAEKQKAESAVEETGSEAKLGKEREDKLNATIDRLTKALSDMEAAANEREEKQRVEVTRLRSKFEQAERRNEELSQEATDATQPLLRQIRNLQRLHEERASSWDSAESLLTERLALAEAKVARDEGTRRLLEEAKSQEKLKVVQLEETILRLKDQLREERALLNSLKKEHTGLLNTLVTTEEDLSANRDAAEEASNKLKFVEQQLNEAMEKNTSLELEVTSLGDKVRHADSKLIEERKKRRELVEDQSIPAAANLRAAGTSIDGTTTALQHAKDSTAATNILHSLLGEANSVDAACNDNKLNPDLEYAINHCNDTLRIPLQRLQHTMVQTNRKLRQMRQQIRVMESDRGVMSEKVVGVEALREEIKDLQQSLRVKDNELSSVVSKQNVLLELLGEKEEAIESLEDSIATMKSMYRQQTTDLLTRIESLEAGK
jgi:TATA element modulatory factor